MTVDTGAPLNAAPSLGGRRWRRWAGSVLAMALLAPLLALGAWHGFLKPLPAGLHVASDWTAVSAGEVRLLFDITAADAYGQPIVQQQIFDESLRVIGAARDFIVLDQFLFNAHHGALQPATDKVQPGMPLRSLSRELRDALVAARRAQPRSRRAARGGRRRRHHRPRPAARSEPGLLVAVAGHRALVERRRRRPRLVAESTRGRPRSRDLPRLGPAAQHEGEPSQGADRR
jgi:hypothetical protein